MATTIPTQTRTGENLKKQAVEPLKCTEDTLGFKPEVLEAMEEAKRISRDPDVKGYTDVKQMFKEILEDGTVS